jgi:hypothetical protein
VSDEAVVKGGAYQVKMCGKSFTDSIRVGLKCEMAVGHKRPCDVRRQTKKELRKIGKILPATRMIGRPARVRLTTSGESGPVVVVRAAGEEMPSTADLFPIEDDDAPAPPRVTDMGPVVKAPTGNRHVRKPPHARKMGGGPVIVGHKAQQDLLR